MQTTAARLVQVTALAGGACSSPGTTAQLVKLWRPCAGANFLAVLYPLLAQFGLFVSYAIGHFHSQFDI